MSERLTLDQILDRLEYLEQLDEEGRIEPNNLTPALWSLIHLLVPTVLSLRKDLYDFEGVTGTKKKKDTYKEGEPVCGPVIRTSSDETK